jgi:hypothetical protein
VGSSPAIGIDKELPSKLFAELPGIPHGMKLEKHPLTNPKVNLHKTLKTQEVEARKKSKLATLSLDAFIISATPFDDLCKQHGPEWNREKYAKAHILFPDSGDEIYLEAMLAD